MRTLLSARASQCERARKNAGVDGRTSGAFRPAQHSALVDISNYVMLEFGHPSHVFDLERLTAPLEVRWGRTGETLTLLNGQTITLDTNTGVIADPHAAQS